MNESFKSELKTTLKVAKWEYLLKLFTSIMIRGLLLIIPVLFSNSINSVTKNEINEAFIIIVISIVVTLIYRAFECFNQYAYYRLYNKLFSYYNGLALSKTKDNSLFSLSRFSPGQYTNIVITDVDIISGFFSNGVIRVVQVIEFLVIYIYFFSLDIVIFISAVILSIIMLLLSFHYGKSIQKLNEKRKANLDNITSSVYDYFGSIREIKSFNLFNSIYPMVENDAKKYLDANGKYNIRFNCNNHIFLFMFELFRLLSIIYAIVVLVSNGSMEVGSLLIVYNYYQKIIDNFSTILTINVEYRNLVVSLQRFNKVVEFSRSRKKGIVLDKGNVNGNIEFSHILYGFRSNPMLSDASFTISANAITVLTGKDEAAQNGIFDLLLKLNRQHEGSILIDGLDINDIDDDSYFELISSVRRQTTFFDVSIKDNFLMINNDFDKVIDICRRLDLDKEIRKLDKGYDTVLTENVPLSQATKELIVVVRMLLKESKILLFDDLINILDDSAEKRLFDMLDDLKKDHTIIIVSHSKYIIDRADYVFNVSFKNVTKER